MIRNSAPATATYRGVATLTSVTQMLLLALVPSILFGRAAPDIITSIIAILFVTHSFLSRDARFLRDRWMQVALALWAYLWVRHCFVPGWQTHMGLALAWVRFPLLAAATVHWLVRDAATRRALIYAMTGTFAVILGDTLYQYFHGTDIFGHKPLIAGPTIRLSGPFDRPRVGITIAWMILPLLLYAIRPQTGRHPLYYLAAALFLVLTLVDVYLAGERMALIFTLVGFVLGGLFYRPARMPMLAAIMAGALCCAAFSYFNHDLVARQLASTETVIGDFLESPYGLPWLSSLHLASDHPLFGVGFKHFTSACLANPPAPDQLGLRCPMHPHNIYFEWLAENGAIGLGLFVLMAGVWLRDIWQSRRLWQTDAIMTGLAVTLIIRLWPLSSSASMFASWAGIPFWLYIGWFYCLLATKRSALDE